MAVHADRSVKCALSFRDLCTNAPVTANGTFLNKVPTPLGRNRSVALHHGDIIALVTHPITHKIELGYQASFAQHSRFWCFHRFCFAHSLRITRIWRPRARANASSGRACCDCRRRKRRALAKQRRRRQLRMAWQQRSQCSSLLRSFSDSEPLLACERIADVLRAETSTCFRWR